MILISALDGVLLSSAATMAQAYGVRVIGTIEKPATRAKFQSVLSQYHTPVADAEAEGEVGAAFGAARLGRLAVSGDAPEAVCELPPVMHTITPDAQLGSLLRQRRPIFDQAYQRLRPLFREFPA